MTEPTDFMESRMLHAYLDGELDGPHEEALFRMLSEDGALRAEMQDHLAIRKAVQHDTQAFTPPAAATAAIFGALGFSIPAATTAAASGAGKIWFASGSAILAVVTSMLLSTLFTSTDQQIYADAGVPAAPVMTLNIEESAPLGDIVSSAPADTRQGRSVSDSQPVLEELPKPTAFEEQPEQLVEIECLPPAAFGERGEPDLRGLRAPFIPYVSFLRMPVDGMMFYLRNTASQSSPAGTFGASSELLMNNLHIGALYPLSRYHALGVEFGREIFPQSFDGTLRGAVVRYEQSPVVYCATAVYQLTAGEVLPLMHPYAQIQAGAAFNLGPLARAGLGVAVKPFEKISLLIGAEGSILAYKFQNKWFDTKKLGLTYGLRYEF
ncbi:MAG: hypothetical protein M5R41_13200 [Bacteroidia bacterium]|nr:hypothetical protein [Bacteroidia bacterium]